MYKILNQRIRTTVQNSINEFDSSTIRSESFNESFFNNLIPQLREQARILGLEIASWTPPMYGLSRQEEKLIELSELEHKKRIAKLEEEIRLIKESPKKEMGDKNLNITNQNVNTGYIGRDFKVSDNFINKKLLVVLGIIISLVTIIYSVI